jgi:hypothetical protein
MKYIKNLSIITTTTIGTILATGLSGCGGSSDTQAQQQTPQTKQNAFVIIEETAPGKYKIKDEFPADETRIVLKQLDGQERVLTQQEMDELIKKEAAKIDDGTSNLTNPNAEVSPQGMSLGEVLLSSMAGAVLGSWIGNKLFGNPAYQNHRKASYKSPSTYTRSQKSFNKPRAKTSNRRGGFFGGNSRSRSRSSFFGG